MANNQHLTHQETWLALASGTMLALLIIILF